MNKIRITGARTHNLKNITLEIPKEKITVVSGISGSGKSSLAFDTVFAEGQRRYVENLSSYAKQVIGVIERPDVDSIEGIPPAIAIDQRSVSRSPRSTVGTLTEIYDYLRILFARFGNIHCPNCKKELVLGSSLEKVAETVYSKIKANGFEKKEITIYTTIVRSVKGTHEDLLKKLARSAFSRFRVDGEEYGRQDIEKVALVRSQVHTIEAQVLKISIEGDLKKTERAEILRALKKGFELGGDTLELEINGQKEFVSKQPSCASCSIVFPAIQPRLFSFNSPHGACQVCQGLGRVMKINPDLVVPNKKLTIAEGAIRPWVRLANQNGALMSSLKELSKKMSFSNDLPVEQLGEDVLRAILYGTSEFEGVVNNLERKYRETDSDYLRQEIEQYMVESICGECGGKRLNSFAGSVKVLGMNICELSDLEVPALLNFVRRLMETMPKEAASLILEVEKRLKNLEMMGLGYLALSRGSESLSGGEAQRIKLGIQFDSFLSGALYVMDEPTISLHSADTVKLIRAFEKLKKEGNTVVVVEHDRSVIESSDYIIDMGPGAGREGGTIVARGTTKEIKANPFSVTGQYLSGRKKIEIPKSRREPVLGCFEIKGARHNNLKDIDVKIPLGLFTCVTGVSGSGKSSLVYDVIAKKFAAKLNRSQEIPGECNDILGIEGLDKAIKIDQSPIGRTPRSNLATFTGLFTPVREIFASQSDASTRNFNASQFSFNLKGGRCENCRGDGYIKIEMFFMEDVYVLCEECSGKRYNQETLAVKYKGKSIADVLEMSVDEASEFFSDCQEVMDKIEVLRKVGLGYLPLGQSATSLSGGEAQRIKLATELSRPSTGKTIYILDEPTTGLHFEDIGRLLKVLQELVDRGNTVLVIEHNLDVIKSADWIIDMGPSGGKEGGRIVVSGRPEDIAKCKASQTGQFLKFLL